MVWAILRRAPSRAYLELENQPAPRVAYTFKLERQRKNRTPNDKNMDGKYIGYSSQRLSARVRLKTGAKIKGSRLAGAGDACSFKNSFNASASGWGRPIRATLFGPLRS